MIDRLLSIFVAVLVLGGCDYKKVEHEVGHMGAARRDPFLAAERFLEAKGFDVSTTTRFGAGPDIPGTVVTPAQSFVNYGMADHVLDWVKKGGHLVVFLRDGEAFRNDWMTFGSGGEEDSETVRLLEKLGVAEVSDSKAEAKGEIYGREVAYESPATFSWRPSEKPRLLFALGESDKPAAAAFRQGKGHVTIIASAKPFRNRYIGDANNAWIFWMLAGHAETNEVWFFQGARISFFAMLWDRGWMAIIGLALLIGFWLWRHLPRFGPLRDPAEESHRDFAGHLEIIGGFQWRHGQTRRLLTPLRETIMRAAGRRGWASGDGKLHEHLANLTGFSIPQVEAALDRDPRDPPSFVAVVNDLQKIAASLHA